MRMPELGWGTHIQDGKFFRQFKEPADMYFLYAHRNTKALQINSKRQENCLNFTSKNVQMKNFCISLTCIVLFMACNSGGDQQAPGADSTATAEQQDTIETFTPVDTSTEFIETFSSNLQPWLERTTRQTTLRLDNFQYADNWVEDSLIESNANLTPDFYKTYQSVLVYSPDSSKVLDLGSYGAMTSKDQNGKTTIVQGEPDAEIAVLDRLTRKRRRVFFFGPGTSVEKGFWMNNTTIILAGKTEDQNVVKPMIWTVKLDSTSNFYKRYAPKE